jgi:hypothetical protein
LFGKLHATHFFFISSSILAGALEPGFVGRLPLLDKGLRELAAKRRM